MKFGEALEMAKMGNKIARIGWNGSGMYAVLMPGYPNGVPCNGDTARLHNVEPGTVVKVRPYWALKTAQGDIAGARRLQERAARSDRPQAQEHKR